MKESCLIDIRQIVGAILLFVSEMEKIIAKSKDFYEIEKGIHEVSQEICNRMLSWALEQIDKRLMEERERGSWEIVGFRTKRVISSFGEFTYKRRLYRNKETGESKFLLDEVLGWPEGARITPRLRELLLKLGSEVSFAKAAEIANYMAPGVSGMTVWHVLREVGEALQQEADKKRIAIFEKGEEPGGKEVTPELNIEADGVIIRLQKSEEKRGEIKHIVAYEGKEERRRGRISLKNKVVISSLKKGEAAWEESYAIIAEKWDLSRAEKVYIGGDGAEWPKQGKEYFPGAKYRLDPYHLRKQLTEALWHDEESYKRVGIAIEAGNWEETEVILLEAMKRSRGKQKERIGKLLSYLKKNWEGIIKTAETRNLGTIEGQIQHNIARRMKRLGARWTVTGGDRMARVLAAKANGRLKGLVGRWPVEREKIKEVVKRKVVEKFKEEDIEKWLRANLPALKGPYAGQLWIKYVLRELTRNKALLHVG